MPWAPTDITNLVDYWDADSGIKTSGAADFVSASTQYLSTANTTAVSPNTSPFYYSAWVYLDATGSNSAIVSKRDAANTTPEWNVYVTAAGALRGVIWIGGASRGVNHGTSFSAGAWTYVELWWDGSSLYVNQNRGTPASTTASGTCNSLSSPLWIGQGGSGSSYWDGGIQAAGYWSAVPSDTIKNSIYNSGTGKLYSDLSASEKTNLVSFWDLTEYSGTRADCNASLDLTATNSPVARYGNRTADVTNDGSIVTSWTGAENSVVYSMSSNIARNPLWYSNSGDAYVDFDGTANYLLTTSGWSTANSSYTFAFRLNVDSDFTSSRYLHDTTTTRLVIANNLATGGASNDSLAFYDGTWRDTDVAATSGEQVLTYVLDNGAGNGKIYKDGSQQGSTQTYSGGTTSTAEKRLGRSITDTNEYFGRIYAFCIATEAVSASDQSSLEDYLNGVTSGGIMPLMRHHRHVNIGVQ